MAPFCAHDCFHMHWRWSDNHNNEPGTFGWGPVKPCSEVGRALVPWNQDVFIQLLGHAEFSYIAQAHGVPKDAWQPFCHHGGGYAVRVGSPWRSRSVRFTMLDQMTFNAKGSLCFGRRGGLGALLLEASFSTGCQWYAEPRAVQRRYARGAVRVERRGLGAGPVALVRRREMMAMKTTRLRRGDRAVSVDVDDDGVVPFAIGVRRLDVLFVRHQWRVWRGFVLYTGGRTRRAGRARHPWFTLAPLGAASATCFRRCSRGAWDAGCAGHARSLPSVPHAYRGCTAPAKFVAGGQDPPPGGRPTSGSLRCWFSL